MWAVGAGMSISEAIPDTLPAGEWLLAAQESVRERDKELYEERKEAQ